MRSIQEVTSMLAGAGSFYYKNLSADGTTIARKLAQLYSNCRVISQLKATATLALSGGYFNDFGIVIHFSDKDIDYFGAKEALQERPVKNELTVKRHVALAGHDNKLLSELDRDANLKQILGFPDESTEEITVATRDTLKYGLYIDNNTFVSSITKDDGTLLLNGVDFSAYFGVILFKQNPAVLFPNGKFVAASVTRRYRNILSFVLGVDVYGPIDRIVEYYRIAQSPKTFYLAAAQAIGMCVVPEDCVVHSVEPLHKGCAYITDIGKLDAPYQHTRYGVGDIITKNTVIGGVDLFDIVIPEESIIPQDLGSVSLDYLLPVKGLSAPNADAEISIDGKFNPAIFEGSEDSKNKYLEFLKAKNGGESLPDSNAAFGNVISYVCNAMAPRRCLILRINESRMYRDMQMSLEHFIERELPIGAVLLKENMVRDF